MSGNIKLEGTELTNTTTDTAVSWDKDNDKKIPAVIGRYDPEKQNGSKDSANFLYAKYRRDMTDVPAQQAAGSTLPLVISKKGGDDEEGSYNPFEHRKVEHPTSDTETLIHLLKGSLGSGILAMPMAFMNAGLWFGLIATIIVGSICTYCVHLLVKCAHILCRRRQIPSMGFADVAEQAFLDGPPKLQKYSRFIKFMVNTFLVLDLIGCCCIYLVFVAKNVKQVIDHYTVDDFSIRMYMLFIMVPLIFMCLIRNLKFLTPFSMIANILIFVGITITMYYIFVDIPDIESRPAIVDVQHWPMFFGTVIFALEGIGVVMSLENDMKTPTHFIGCPSVLNFGMGTVISMYAFVGFFGYLKYGDSTEGSITLNLPTTEIFAQSAKLMIALAIFFTYTLQFYVPIGIIWNGIKHKFSPDNHTRAELALRVVMVIFTVAVAAALPNLGPFITLIGAVCLSTLGLMIPAIIELAVYNDDPGMGRFNWRLWKNSFLILMGIIGFFTGTYVSIVEFAHEFKE